MRQFRLAVLSMVVAAASGAGLASPDDYQLASSSFLGGPGFDDAVVGAAFSADGTIVLAANLSAGAADKLKPAPQGTLDTRGCLVRLSADGTKVLSIVSVADEVRDLAADAKGDLYLAAGAGGIVKLSGKDGSVVLSRPAGKCERVDAGADGHFAAIVDGNIAIFSPAGQLLGTAKGQGYTNDVCVDSASKTVIFCGFRNAKAFDGKKTYPVQICYIHGLGYDGQKKWTAYDWSTDQASERFINKPTNNMADTRADRCTIGQDGKLYVTFQVAGGNHIFRYSPTDIMAKASIVGGDAYHGFHNSKSEHKNFFARYEPGSGAYLAGQQFCGRLDGGKGKANSVATKEGQITADAEGNVYLAGKAASGLPLSLNPGGEYMGGGFLLVMSADLKRRLLCTRTGAGATSPRALAVGRAGGKTRIVLAGSGAGSDLVVKNAPQAQPADSGTGKDDPKDAFVSLFEKG